jgi:hypothetical protein
VSNAQRITRAAAALMTASALVLAVPATAKADEATAACGSQSVSLDWLRANDTTEVGHDEVYINYSYGERIWPTSQEYVSIADGETVQVNHCVSNQGIGIQLWDVDDSPNDDDALGTVFINGEASGEYDIADGRYTIDIDPS